MLKDESQHILPRMRSCTKITQQSTTSITEGEIARSIYKTLFIEGSSRLNENCPEIVLGHLAFHHERIFTGRTFVPKVIQGGKRRGQIFIGRSGIQLSVYVDIFAMR